MLYHETNPGTDWATVDLATLKGQPVGTLIHGDMHCGNVCVDVMDSASMDHACAPRLKLIDFGNARDLTPDAKAARLKNIGIDEDPDQIAVFECAYVMVSLLMLTPGTTLEFGDDFDLNWNGTPIRCIAGVLNQAGPGLVAQKVDQNLIGLICLCRARDPRQRPGLLDLALNVQDIVNKRDRAFYEGRHNESNRGCIYLMQDLLVKTGYAEGELDVKLPDDSDSEDDEGVPDGNRDTMDDDEDDLGQGGRSSSSGQPGGSKNEGRAWRNSRWSPYQRGQ